MPIIEISEDKKIQGLVRAFDEVISDALKNAEARPIKIILKEREIKEVTGFKHEAFNDILKALALNINLFLVGPAGSGKTQLVENAAEALNKKFYTISVCSQTTASALLGYMDATGKYVRSLFRDAYENGGVFLLDEIDNGNPNVLSVLNSALSNEYCAFPDRMVKRNPDFILCASGNTYGTGADRQYVGRLEIDAATLDRFVFMEINYDEKLERAICGHPEYALFIQEIRTRVNKLNLRYIVSPRASIFGAILLKAGFNIKDILQWTVYKSMKKEDIAKLIGKDKEKEKYEELLKAIK